MGTTLTGTTPQDTYDSLIKVTDNGPISATAKYLSDGLGNDSILALSTARVGIGTTSGTSKANILSATVAQTVLTLEGNYAGSGSVELLEFNRSGGAVSGAIKYQDADTAMAIGTTTSHAFLFNTGDTEKMRVTSAGDVGIGTGAPSSKLHLSGTSTTFQVTDSNKLTNNSLHIRAVSQTAWGIGTDASGTFTGTKLAITDAGNVGIGTITPAVTLDVGGNIRSSTGILFGTDTAAANLLDDYEEGTWTMGVAFGGASVGVTTSANTGTYTKIGRQVTVNGYIQLTSKGSSTGNATITGLPFAIGNGNGFYTAASSVFFNLTFANQFQIQGANGTAIMELLETTILGTLTYITDADFANNTGFVLSMTYFV